MAREKRNLTLPEDVNAMLENVGNASEYVGRIVTERWTKWMTALTTLRTAGWASNEMLAACDVLNGYWMIERTAGRRPGFVAVELHDAQQLNNICDKWDVPPRRWGERVKALGQSEELADAIVTLAAEFWSGNEACETAIRRDERTTRKE